jgi:hypothetical protein
MGLGIVSSSRTKLISSKNALAVASEQRAGDKVAHLKAETEKVHNARTLKKCSA